MANEFSQTWFDTFLAEHGRASTPAELALLRHVLPLPRFRRILDVCAGIGRHALPLADAGYEVTALDRDERALARLAQRAGDRVDCVPFDMRALGEVTGPFDAVICMWKSFGWFSDETNAAVLAQMAAQAGAGGRVVLDLLHRPFLESGAFVRERRIAGGRVVETNEYDGTHLTASLWYLEQERRERFRWRVYGLDELDTLAASCGLTRHLVCTANDPARAPAEADAEVQVVYARG